MYLHYTYFLHDAYTKLTCTTYNTYITIQLQVKLNYSWSIYVIVCMLLVQVTNKNFVC